MTTGQVVTVASLLGLGWDRAQVSAAIDAGTLVEVVRGWVAYPTADSLVIEAVEKGGRLGCLSGCRVHGLWTPDHSEPHIIIGRGEKRRRSAWHRHTSALPGEAVFPVAECIAQVIRHHSPEEALMVLESAVQKGLVTRMEAEVLIADCSSAKQNALRFFDPRAESGSETRVRMWLQQVRVQVRPQVQIPGVGRVDLVVGNSLIVECDSERHHKYTEEDYARDLAAKALGFETLRLSYRQIFLEWDDTKEHLLRRLSTKAHLKHPKPL